MTRDDIIRMAHESYCSRVNLHTDQKASISRLARFAALVAAEERKTCAEICEEAGDIYAAKVIRMRDNSEDKYPA
jgi:hypothetical protein